MNLTNVTINVSSKAKKTLTPEEQKQNEFMKMSLTKKMEYIYDKLMDHEDRISALEPETEPDPTTDEQTEQAKTYNFTSYSDVNRTTQYATGTVETTGVTKMYNDAEYTEVVVTNNTVAEFIDKKYYIISDAQLSIPANDEYHVYQLYEYDETNDTLKSVEIWVTITE